jgi:hypothetical protein
MTDKDLKGGYCGLMAILPRYLPGPTEENHKVISHKSGVPVEIGNKCPQNASGGSGRETLWVTLI